MMIERQSNEDEFFQKKMKCPTATKALKEFWSIFFNNNPAKMRDYIEWYFSNLLFDLIFIEVTNFNKTLLSVNTLKMFKTYG